MKLTNDTLRKLYLADLSLPDTFHGRTTPKVKYIGIWEAVTSMVVDDTYFEPAVKSLIDRDVWVWSDQHFGHKNIIEYTNRPFKSVEHMNNALIENYLSVVKPDDIVIWCGDIAFLQDVVMNSILDQLPGYKIQVIGNHDFDRSQKLKNLSMDERHLCYVLNIVEGGREFQLLFTHYPMTNVPKNCVNIHGHIHQNMADAWNINVSVEHTNYTPINLKELTARALVYLESQ